MTGMATEGTACVPPDVLARVARATARRHAFSPLTGLQSFWERVASAVLGEYLALGGQGASTPDVITGVATAAAPQFVGSPIILSERLWHGIVATVVTEYREPSGLGETFPNFRARAGSDAR